MRYGAELDLPNLPMEADAFAADPFTPFEAARAVHRCLARWSLGYVVTDYKAMRDLFAMNAVRRGVTPLPTPRRTCSISFSPRRTTAG